MGSAIAAWVADNREIYLGNATAMRDFRVQLRGNRSVILFGLYLVVLIGVAMLNYSDATSTTSTVVEAQSRLQSFYTMTMGLLGLAVCVVAPALTATSIVMERQRQSIDLVFSAPVSPKYYLVGKMISSFRYTWMLLVLALPVTAASVVLGGASWSDVLISYLLLSLQGLILTSFALLMSTIAPKPVGAIIWSYAATIAYNLFALAAAQWSMFMHGMRIGTSGEAPFFIGMSPWTVTEAARTTTILFGAHVPNWILMAIYALLVAKLCLLGAGTLLSPSGGKEIVGLRFFGLLYISAITGIAGWSVWPIYSTLPPSSFASIEISNSALCAFFVTWCSWPMFTFVPFLASYGFDRERRFRPNGIFGIRHLLDGTPSGGLPYLLAMMVCMYGGFAAGAKLHEGLPLGKEFWIFALFATSFWVMLWAFGRLFSSIFPTLKMSRIMVFTLFLVFAVMPYPFLIAVAGTEPDPGRFSLWDLYIMSPLVGRGGAGIARPIILTGVMLGVSFVLAGIAEARTRKKLAGIRNYDEQPHKAA